MLVRVHAPIKLAELARCVAIHREKMPCYESQSTALLSMPITVWYHGRRSIPLSVVLEMQPAVDEPEIIHYRLQ